LIILLDAQRMGCLHPVGDLPVALFLGGFDPSAGAGILRDSAVASGLGVFSMAIPMAETIQNGLECNEVAEPSIDPARRLSYLAPHLCGKWGVKLSMFHSSSILHDVLSIVDRLAPSLAIWDPILAPTHGAELHKASTIQRIIGKFAPDLWVISPNIPEARLIADIPDGPLEEVAEKIMDMGMKSVWIRGGHASGCTVQDLWCDKNGFTWMPPCDHLAGDPRGTGCTVTAAWLAYRLCGMDPICSIGAAIQYIRSAWKYLHVPGKAGRLTFPPKVD
jgi:hydroxymethylpyrimidine kinase/phosphomethylpyrimidine kinase